MNSPESICGALERILKDPEAAGEIGSRARSHAIAQFDIRKIVHRYEAVYEEVIQGRR
jgi:glycosyltransferase involved in cell wall biosynthesis